MSVVGDILWDIAGSLRQAINGLLGGGDGQISNSGERNVPFAVGSAQQTMPVPNPPEIEVSPPPVVGRATKFRVKP